MATAARTISAAEAARQEVEAYLAAQQRKDLLRFITCGSVDDGKSTLIGRLLYDSKLLFEDQLAALEADSKKVGTQGQEIDFALLVDGLAAEREQGITIDVAYRFFSTDQRKFIVADTPGHEQYTRNMVTGASTADLAIILIDARKGVLTQTRRHSYLAHLLGIRNLVLAVNKIDLVGYSAARFEEIVADYQGFADEVGIASFTAIPLSGLRGDNVTARSAALPWYGGPTLIEHLETVPVTAAAAAPFRMAVQWVNRPNSGFRGYAGQIASGSVQPGDRVTVLPSGQSSTVERIVAFGGDLAEAGQGRSITLTLADEIDCSRGNVLVAATEAPLRADRLVADIVWMAEEALVPGRSYWLKVGAQTVSASVERVEHVVDMASLAHGEGRSLALNDIGKCRLRLDRRVAGFTYQENKTLGAFILIDKIGHGTVAAGLVRELADDGAAEAAEETDDRILWVIEESRAERAALAARHHEAAEALGRLSFVLDDAILRSGISDDLADDEAARAEHVRRAREVARLLGRAGVHVVVAVDAHAGEAHPGRRAGADPARLQDWVI